MNPLFKLLAIAHLLFAICLSASAQGTAFTYQGQLQSSGSPASGLYDFVFSLSNAPSGGSQVGGSVTNLAVGVTNGLFTTTLDFGAVFTGNDTWLAISVRTNGTGGYAGLTPLQPLTPTPYAVMAGSASQLGSLVVQQNASGAPNLIGGAPFNFASSGVYGATISGGGGTNVHYGPMAHLYTNSVIGNFGTVGGGAANTASGGATVGGGQNNSASGSESTVAGGYGNTASGSESTVGGGYGNVASGDSLGAATVSGGSQNSASDDATVGGGNNNQATNVFATVPGGYSNVAGGQSSFAAGTYAQALHLGAFVWSDAEGTPFASTAPNQFNVRANGGVNFVTSGAGMTLDGQALATATPPGMALIPAGSFTMGALDGLGDAIPTDITVSAFYMDINLVTYAQWQSVYFWATNHGNGFVNAGAGKAANHPVQAVDWYDSVKWSNARSQQAGLTPVYYTDAGFTQIYTNGEVAPYQNLLANGYRLPTEAEWEKAARGGLSGQRFPWGNVITENLANYNGAPASYNYDLGPNGFNPAFTNVTSYPYTSPVGYFAPNGYGLYDMAGNVLEWCWDWYGTPYGQPTNTNPTGSATGSNRVLRGGSWVNYADIARCANRVSGAYPFNAYNYFGFRCVRGH